MHKLKIFIICFSMSVLGLLSTAAGANHHDKVLIDRELLTDAFLWTTVSTSTPWSDGKNITYRGVPLHEVVRFLRLDTGQKINVEAANGFSRLIALSDIAEYKPMLVYDVSCQSLQIESVRCAESGFVPLSALDHGPVFLIWPSTNGRSSEIQSDNSVWVWFVTSISAVK